MCIKKICQYRGKFFFLFVSIFFVNKKKTQKRTEFRLYIYITMHSRIRLHYILQREVEERDRIPAAPVDRTSVKDLRN